MNDPVDKRPFAETMQMLCAAYRVEATKPLLAGYWAVLRSLPLAEVQSAVMRALELAREFMPSAADLRRIARPATLPYHKPYSAPAFEPREEWPALPPVEGGDDADLG